MIVPPALIDIGTDTDAGFWLRELPFASFPVSDFNPVDNAPAGRPDGDRFTGSVRSFHELRDNPEAQRDHL